MLIRLLIYLNMRRIFNVLYSLISVKFILFIIVHVSICYAHFPAIFPTFYMHWFICRWYRGNESRGSFGLGILNSNLKVVEMLSSCFFYKLSTLEIISFLNW
jgi:hypothetical protein